MAKQARLPAVKPWLTLTLLLAASTSVGCAAGDQLQLRAAFLTENAERIHDAAYNCAERELAMAESHLDFGTYELERGNYLRARDHLDIAYENLEVAMNIVDARPECWPDYVADTDGDGLLDDVDQCIHDPEDFDEWEDEDGCPDDDNDGDGIFDIADGCPNDPEDFDMWEDEDGCPDDDNDGDGYADWDDDCPNEPEDFDGDQDEDGCPDEYEYATIEGEQIVINQQIHFAYDSARILPESYPILDDVASILRDNPTIEIRIEGHTDSDGTNRYNQRLSEERAASVRAYLIRYGEIAPSRMISVGMGEEFPLVPNDSDANKALNRRVEFHIIAR